MSLFELILFQISAKNKMEDYDVPRSEYTSMRTLDNSTNPKYANIGRSVQTELRHVANNEAMRKKAVVQGRAETSTTSLLEEKDKMKNLILWRVSMMILAVTTLIISIAALSLGAIAVLREDRSEIINLRNDLQELRQQVSQLQFLCYQNSTWCNLSTNSLNETEECSTTYYMTDSMVSRYKCGGNMYYCTCDTC